MSKAHDIHGLHGFLKVVLVLLARNWDVSIWQEAIVVESFQKQVRWEKEESMNKYSKQC